MLIRETTLRQALLGGVASAAMFCSVGGATAYAESEILEEIIVTAQKRSENLQDIAVSAHVFNSDLMESLKLDASAEFVDYIPNVSVNFANGTYTPNITIRGVGVQSFTSNFSPSAPFYVDEQYLASNAMFGFQVFDIERIEVLKGPQGTLYGKNTTAGAINIITKKPTQEREGYVEISYGNYQTVESTFAISGPLSDKISARIAGRTENRLDGYQFNVTQDRDNGRYDRWTLRGHLQFDPTEDLNILLTLTGGKDRHELPGPEFRGVRDAPGETCPIAEGFHDPAKCTNFFGFQDLDGDPNTVYFDRPIDDTESEFLTTKLEVNWDMDFATLTSLTTYTNFKNIGGTDVDSTNIELGQIHNFSDLDLDTWSQELRLASNDESDLTWVVGAYYDKAKWDSVNWLDVHDNPDLPPFFKLLGLFNADQAARDATRLGLDYTQDSKSWAVFGQADWRFDEAWQVSLGLRYTDYKKMFDERSFWSNFTDGLEPQKVTVNIPGDEPIELIATEKDEQVSGRAAINHWFSDDVMVYGAVSQSFKDGGNDVNVAFSLDVLQPYDKEKVTAYEVGLRSTLADGSLRFNLTSYYYDYTNLQATITKIVNDIATSKLDNIGTAEFYGIEMDSLWQPAPGLTVSLAAAWQKTKITSEDQTGGPFGTVSIKGNELPNAPHFTANGLVRYEFPLTDALNGAGQIHVGYSDNYYTNLTNDEFLAMDAYARIDAAVSVLTSDDGGWELTFWGKNLTDKLIRNRAVNTVGAANVHYQMPRTYGATFRWNFN